MKHMVCPPAVCKLNNYLFWTNKVGLCRMQSQVEFGFSLCWLRLLIQLKNESRCYRFMTRTWHTAKTPRTVRSDWFYVPKVVLKMTKVWNCQQTRSNWRVRSGDLVAPVWPVSIRDVSLITLFIFFYVIVAPIILANIFICSIIAEIVLQYFRICAYFRFEDLIGDCQSKFLFASIVINTHT